MAINQLLSFAVIALMMAAFVWGRFRYDLVACGVLIVALAVGIVPYDAAFSGFSDDIVIIVGNAFLVSAGVARSGIMELSHPALCPERDRGPRPAHPARYRRHRAVGLRQEYRRAGDHDPDRLPVRPQVQLLAVGVLMSMAFGSLLGGLMTQIGTSPNIVVSRVREEITVRPFPCSTSPRLAAALAAAGIVFLALFYWLVPVRTREAGSIYEALDIHSYVTEARVVAKSAVNGKTVADLLKYAGGEVVVTSILRSRVLHIAPLPDAVQREGDIMLIEGPPEPLDRIVAQARLSVTGSRDAAGGGKSSTAIEAVIGEHSSLIGWSAQRLALYDRFNVNLLAVSRKGERITERLGAVTLRLGDILVLQGNPQRLPDILRELGALPLAERPILLGTVRRGIVPVLILLAAMGASAGGLLPVPIAFFTAAFAMVLFRVVPLREVYAAIDGPILVMLSYYPSQRFASPNWCYRRHRRMARRTRQHFAAGRRADADPDCRHDGDAVPQQRRHRAGRGADCGRFRRMRLPSRSLSDGGRYWRRLRFPHSDWPSVQHTCHGPRRLSFQRLPTARPAAIDAGHPGRRSDAHAGLAVAAVF